MRKDDHDSPGGGTVNLADDLGKLLDATAEEQGTPIPEPVREALLDDALDLLARGGAQTVGVTLRSISHGDLHRHLFVIRCPDQAFFLDGIKVYLSHQQIQVLARHTLVMCATHDAEGAVTRICTPDRCNEGNEMLIVLQISAALVPDGARVYRDMVAIARAVQESVRDFSAMDRLLGEAAQHLRLTQPDAAALLGWMRDGKYIQFGMERDGSRLGIMRNRATLRRVAPGLLDDLAALEPAAGPGLEWLYLPHGQRLLYGATHLEVVRVTWQDNRGRPESVLMLGYFSRSARYTNASQTPLLGRVWDRLKKLPPLSRSSYLQREVRTLFDRMPKPVLLSIPAEELLDAMITITEAGSPDRALVFDWRPHPGHVRLILAVIDRSRYSRPVEEAVLDVVRAAGFPPVHYYTVAVGPSVLLFVSTVGEGELENLTRQIQECAVTWRDRARASVRAALKGPELPRAIELLAAVPRLYTDLFPPETFVSDLAIVDRVRADHRPHVRLETSEGGIDLHICTALPVPLGELVTVVQRFGLSAQKEVVVEFPGEPPVPITTLHCTYPRDLHTAVLPRLKEALEAVLGNTADNDAVNALVLSAHLDAGAVAAIITLRNHLVQLVPDAGPGALTRTLTAWPKASAALYGLFAARHAPDGDEDRETLHSRAADVFETALAEIANLTDDRWFRYLGALVEATLRTNAFTRPPGHPVANKIDPTVLPFAVKPRPYREIFVHGRHVEGVHLRGGPVARGGLRLSDRPSDFRTEVLELMATQQLKNCIIVPQGAKGGFVLKAGSGPDFTRSQYRAFVAALLSVTDNLHGEEVVPPAAVRVPPEDADDPYLVVAADKGTAAFSDLANAEAEAARFWGGDTGFWLGDAFASGGSHGYDHKKHGITARGAWECVRHHFAHLGVDPERNPVTIAAIGDMGGDVFGNGLLLSQSALLVAAFNHRHVFLDPNPDPASAYAERARLFKEVAGWNRYNASLISNGGGVFDRSAKRIQVSSEAAARLGVEPGPMSGEELIRAILKSPVDLLYNGGIGTYVKATAERNDEARDPANNSVRVNAADLRCKVVGEGGNLGFTQRARIEYARAGGRINTDAIDNSGGVDMSDHEVNLKILLARAPDAPAVAVRNRLLGALGPEVAEQCLENNRSQARAISLTHVEVRVFPARLRRLRNRLMLEGGLDPAVHPGTETGAEDTLALRPQLAVLLGHEKNRLTAALEAADFADTAPFANDLLTGYFPARVRKNYPYTIHLHPLRAGIVNTMASSALVDRCGMLAVSHLQDLVEGATVSEIAVALLAADHLLDAAPLRQAVREQEPDLETALELEIALQSHVQHLAEELLRLHQSDQINTDWLAEKRERFRRFAHLLEKESHPPHWGSTPAEAQLDPVVRKRLDALPMLARSGAALEAAAHMKVPLTRALAAGRAAFDLLPFATCEMQLRSPSWGEGEPYLLRRAWLGRLVRMRSQAIDRLLATGKRDLLATGAATWHRHPRWNMVAELAAHLEDVPDAEPMRVVLLLTHLESLIDDTA